MLYRVRRPFRDLDGNWKTRDHIMEVEDGRAAKLRGYGLLEPYRPPEKAVAQAPERAEPPAVETATFVPEETAAKRPRGRPRKSEE